MSQRTDLLESIANTIQDYRGGSLPQPLTAHVERWVQQFDAAVQLPILQEIDHVLKKIYFSKEDVAKFLRGAMRTQKLTGDRPDKFWRSASFLDIQGGGSSQTDMLALFSEQLEDEHGFGIDDCGQGDEVFIYLDARILNRPEVMIGAAQNKIDADGQLTDAPTREYLTAQLQAFASFVRQSAG